jgi:hypothetical protein
MKRRIKKIAVSVSIVILLGVSVIIYFRFRGNNNYEKQGAVLIDKIEKFRKQNKRLPNNLIDLGIAESINGPYYEKKRQHKLYCLF